MPVVKLRFTYIIYHPLSIKSHKPLGHRRGECTDVRRQWSDAAQCSSVPFVIANLLAGSNATGFGLAR